MYINPKHIYFLTSHQLSLSSYSKVGTFLRITLFLDFFQRKPYIAYNTGQDNTLQNGNLIFALS